MYPQIFLLISSITNLASNNTQQFSIFYLLVVLAQNGGRSCDVHDPPSSMTCALLAVEAAVPV